MSSHDCVTRDGLSGSNSYNFIAQGFDGVLVEPFPEHQQRLVSNLRPYMDSTTQRVQLVKGVVSDVDGRRTLNVFDGENSKTSNTVLDPATDPHLARWQQVRRASGRLPRPWSGLTLCVCGRLGG